MTDRSNMLLLEAGEQGQLGPAVAELHIGFIMSSATAVMFTALVALVFYGEPISARRTVGLIAGFVGVAVLASGKMGGISVWPAAHWCPTCFHGDVPCAVVRGALGMACAR